MLRRAYWSSLWVLRCKFIFILKLFLLLKIFSTYWSESYTRSSEYSCQKCSEIKYNIWIIVLLSIWTLISIFLAVSGHIGQIEKNIIHKCAFRLNRVQNENNLNVNNGIYIKILTNYLQIIGSVSSFGLQIPTSIF